MKTNKFKIKTILGFLSLGLLVVSTSCVKDLDRTPITDTTGQVIYSNFANYPNALAKLYGGLANGGQDAGGGNSDISGIDGNFAQYTRILFSLQELPTDEAVIAWNDGTIQSLNMMTWDPSSEFISGTYSRLYTEIAFCNEFLRNTTDQKLASNNITGANLTEAKFMRAEARFIRALSYYYILDLFGGGTFVDETYLPGSLTPAPAITRANLFKYVEKELLACSTDLKPAKTNEYARADQAAAWALLAKLYLNAEVYTGTPRYTDVITYADKIIAAGYSIKHRIVGNVDKGYQDLFLADNHLNNPETIFPVAFDGVRIQTYGGTTFMVHAAVGGKMPASDFGIGGGWGGLRVTKSFVELFKSSDTRGNFFTGSQTLEIDDLSNFSNGYGFVKYKNITSTGEEGIDGPKKGSGTFVDCDIPLLRLADVYLMYAEANLRGGGGSAETALAYVNELRKRGGASPVTSLTKDFILDERARELSWELTRRTDLIRFGKFTNASYLWPWKGGVKGGQGVGDFRNLYPIPAKELVANPNLVQNPGY